MRFLPYLFATLLVSAPAVDYARAQSTDCAVTGISSEDAPPPLPDYDQPPVPGPDYVWTPGYWAWNNVDYYWVPGTWVEPPRTGLLWTPPYWGFVDGAYVFHRGYWGPHVGFYGGVAYGYGYTGEGFEGGRWDHGAFYYNRSVTNLNGARITNVYNKTVIINNNTRISYNGGRAGLTVKPTPAQEAAAREPHVPPTRMQTEPLRAASVNGSGFASANHGRPAVAATPRPGDFTGPGAMPARIDERKEHEMGMPGQAPGMEKSGMEKPGMEKPAAAMPAMPEHGGMPGKPPQGGMPGVAVNPGQATRPGEDKRLREHAPGVMEGAPGGMRMNENTHAKPAAERPRPEARKPPERPNAPRAGAAMHGGFSGGGAPMRHAPAPSAPPMRATPRPAPAMHAAPRSEHPPHFWRPFPCRHRRCRPRKRG